MRILQRTTQRIARKMATSTTINSSPKGEREKRSYTFVTPVILGSSSWSRSGVLTWRGIPFKKMKPDIDERNVKGRTDASLPKDVVLAVSRAKRDALLPQISSLQSHPVGALLICCDQVVISLQHPERALEKPLTAEEARANLQSYAAGGGAACVSGICVTNTATGMSAEGYNICTIKFNSNNSNNHKEEDEKDSKPKQQQQQLDSFSPETIEAILQPAQSVPYAVMASKVLLPELKKAETMVSSSSSSSSSSSTTTQTTESHHSFIVMEDETNGTKFETPLMSEEAIFEEDYVDLYGMDQTTVSVDSIANIYECAGGLCIEHPSMASNIVSIEGGGVDAVHGLPWPLTRYLIRKVLVSTQQHEEEHPLLLSRVEALKLQERQSQNQQQEKDRQKETPMSTSAGAGST